MGVVSGILLDWEFHVVKAWPEDIPLLFWSLKRSSFKNHWGIQSCRKLRKQLNPKFPNIEYREERCWFANTSVM